MILEGKKGLITGVANKRSLAWAIAQSAAAAGAELAFTYQGERLEKNVRALAEEMTNPLILPCDVTKDEEMKSLADSIQKEWGGLDFFIHAIAFAPKEVLEGEFLATDRESFSTALDISAYSLTHLSRELAPLMEGRDGSIVALSYLGSERVIPHYNVMGVAKAALESSIRYLAYDLGPKNIRVNGISAGPVKTLSASGISGFSTMLDHIADRSPLKRNIDASDVGETAAFLVSKMSRGITGEVLFVDAGYHAMGM